MEVKVTVKGVEYPCRPTMGAMIRFKQLTGKEVTEMKETDLSELCIYLYCCVASASAADGKDFDMTSLEFADALDQKDLQQWVSSVSTGDSVPDENGEKKR